MTELAMSWHISLTSRAFVRDTSADKLSAHTIPCGPAPSGVSQVDPLPGTAPVEVAVVSGAAPGAASGGAAFGGAEPGGAGSEGAGCGGAEPEGVEPGGAESEGAEPGGAESEGAESGGAEPRGAASSGGLAGASPRLSSQQLREWLVQRPHRRGGAPGAGEPGDAGAGGAAIPPGAGDPSEPGAAGAGGAGAAVDPGAGGAGGAVRPRPYFVPLLQQVFGVPSSTGLTERREPAYRPISPVRTARRAPRLRPPPVPGTHIMTLRPSSVPLRVPLPAPPESSLSEVPDPDLMLLLLSLLSYLTLLLPAVLTTPANPPSVGGECALGTDVLKDRQEDFECLAVAVPWFASLLLAPEGDPDAPDIPTPRSYAEAIMGPYSSQWQAAMDAEMASWKSTGTYVDEVPPPGVNIVNGMWIFKVKRPLGSPPAFTARYVARGFSQRQGVDYFQTFSPTPKMTTLWVLLHVAAQRDNELHSLYFSTTFLQGSLHEEIWLRRPPGFTGSFPTSTQTTLAALGFVPSTADSSLFLRTDTSLPPFYVLVYVDDLVFATADTEALTLLSWPADHPGQSTAHHYPDSVTHGAPGPSVLRLPVLLATAHSSVYQPSGPYPELVGCLITSGMGLVLGGRGPVVLTVHADASWAEIYAGAMAAQELRWLTYLLTDLGEQPRSPPVLYVDNKAMIAVCQEHRWEHGTKHIALRYFLALELQQRGQLRLAYVATRANIADVFTKALPPGDHQRFVTVLGLVPTLPHLLTA
ncbi:unnamed protein product [Closterium sp. NIES-54]